MGDLAETFFLSTVKPTVDEFHRSPLDVRRGRLAAIVLYHMADYWNVECNEGCDRKTMADHLEALHQKLFSRCPDFRMIRDAADASKHARLFEQTKLPREMSSSDQIVRESGIFNAPFNTAVFNEASRVMVILDDGTSRPLLGAINSVLAMWEQMIAADGHETGA